MLGSTHVEFLRVPGPHAPMINACGFRRNSIIFISCSRMQKKLKTIHMVFSGSFRNLVDFHVVLCVFTMETFVNEAGGIPTFVT